MEAKKVKVDPEMLKNLDFLMAMDALEEEDNWELLEKDDKDPESLKVLEEMSEAPEEEHES